MKTGKTFMKKAIALLLCAVMLLPFAGIASASGEELPIVYIHGAGNKLYNEKGETIYGAPVDVQAIVGKYLAPLSASIALGAATDNWKPCSDVISDFLDYYFGAMQYGTDGKPIEGGSCGQLNNLAAISPQKSGYGLYTYAFRYDWRADPLESAESLAEYIDAVLAATGKSKVRVCAFSLGSAVLASYIKLYGSAKLDAIVLHSPAVNGAVCCGSPLTGKIKFDPEMTDKFVSTFQSYGIVNDDALTDFLSAFVTLLNKLNTLGIATDVLNKFYENAGVFAIDYLGIKTIGTFPGMWAMISDEYYDEAKAVTFKDKEEEYAVLIDKIDYYHENIQTKAYEIYEGAKNSGVKISVIAKYGVTLLPLFEDDDVEGDGIVALKDQSFGATCTKINSALPESYLASQRAAGLGDYLSPDGKVDASTCLFKDSTWFIKGIQHSVFDPELKAKVDALTCLLLTSEAQPTNGDSNFPARYITIDKENDIEPVEEENDGFVNDVISAFIRFLSSIINFIKGLFPWNK